MEKSRRGDPWRPPQNHSLMALCALHPQLALRNEDGYKKFYEQSGMCPKPGAPEDSTIRTKVAGLMRYHSSSGLVRLLHH